MKLKHGKRYETADGTVYKVRDMNDGFCDYANPYVMWFPNGCGFTSGASLIRRHYTKPKPAAKLDLQPGDVVELVAWEDGAIAAIGALVEIGKTDMREVEGYYLIGEPQGQRPLFKIISRASWAK